MKFHYFFVRSIKFKCRAIFSETLKRRSIPKSQNRELYCHHKPVLTLTFTMAISRVYLNSIDIQQPQSRGWTFIIHALERNKKDVGGTHSHIFVRIPQSHPCRPNHSSKFQAFVGGWWHSDKKVGINLKNGVQQGSTLGPTLR